MSFGQFPRTLNAIRDNNYKVIDEHSGMSVTTKRVMLFQDTQGKTHTVPVFDGQPFCLNPIEVDADGIPRLSRTSVGGVVNGRTDSLDDIKASYQGSGSIIAVAALA